MASSTPEPSGLDPDLDVVVDDPLDGHENFHGAVHLSDEIQALRSSARSARLSIGDIICGRFGNSGACRQRGAARRRADPSFAAKPRQYGRADSNRLKSLPPQRGAGCASAGAIGARLVDLDGARRDHLAVEQRDAAAPQQRDTRTAPARMPPTWQAQETWSSPRDDQHDELEGDPQDERDIGRDAQRNAAEGQHPDLHPRMQHQIGRDDAGDGARRADQRHLRGRRQRCRARRPPAIAQSEIEEQEAEMAERVLDIVAEHPEEQHVAAEMEDVAVQEGIGDVGQVLRHEDAVRRAARRVSKATDGMKPRP